MTVEPEWRERVGSVSVCMQLSAFSFCPFMHQRLWGLRQAVNRHEKASTKLFVFVRNGKVGRRNPLNIKLLHFFSPPSYTANIK